ncbi:MAG: type II toxin-antitoxin system VapC family toxin [Gammaproteobacteria bacterium]|nr:type II toxin-antitoxin system VapC family toxin [Gammaproteobacteria bacterium]MDE0611905.1 type II toxin-antitoxin system VapC family toxin [Gammaproteobacteria bacterium]
MRRFLLDTGVLLGFIRKAEWAERVWKELNLDSKEAIIFTSIICVGELLALSEKLGWGKSKKSRLEEVLAKYSALDINDQGVLRAYAMIDAWTHGQKVDAPRRTPPPKPAISMQQNDLWIAATAHESQATLLSTDKDFKHLKEIWFGFHYVDQNH